MKTIVLDDDKLVHVVLKEQIKKTSEISESYYFTSPFEALEYLDNNKVDLVFLDINMPEMSGLEFLNELDRKGISLHVVIITSDENYAAKVINNKKVVYFIKKPIIDYAVKEAVKAVIEKKETSENINKNFRSVSNNKTNTFFPFNSRLVNIKHDEILFIKSIANGGVEVVTNEEEISSSLTLKEVEEKIQSDNFFRVHKSYIVNLKNIELIFDNLIIIKKNNHIPVGRKYSAAFKELLSK